MAREQDRYPAVPPPVTNKETTKRQKALLEQLCIDILNVDSVDRALELIIRTLCRLDVFVYGEAWLPTHRGTRLTCTEVFWCDETVKESISSYRQGITGLTLEPGDGLLGEAWTSGRIRQACRKDMYGDPLAASMSEARLESIVVLPVQSHSETMAVLVFYRDREDSLDDDWIRWMQGATAQLGSFIRFKKAETASGEYQRKLRKVAGRLAAAENEERKRIARSLHDGVGQTLSLARIRTGVLRRLLPGRYAHHLDTIADLIEEADEQTQSLTFQLSPPVLYELGLPAALSWLSDHIRKEHDLPCHVDVPNTVPPMEDSMRDAVFQMVRELARNVVKHAGASNISIRARYDDHIWRLTVTDDGKGFDPKQDRITSNGSGYGLFHVRERAEFFGGTLDVRSTPDQGTEILIRLPDGDPTARERHVLPGEKPS